MSRIPLSLLAVAPALIVAFSGVEARATQPRPWEPAAALGPPSHIAQGAAREGAPLIDAPWGPEAPSGLSAEVFYRLMVAEVAAQRGEAEVAAREFLALARETGNADIARRATETALSARVFPVALQGATLWLELDPGSERAQRVLTALKASTGSLGEVREHLRRLVADQANAGKNTPEIFMQLNRMLGAQQDRLGVFRLVRELAAEYPSLPEAHFAVAAAGLTAGSDEAELATATEAAIARALELRPGWDRAALLKAQWLARRSPAEALEWLRAFSGTHPEARSVRTAFAQYLVEQRRYADARAEFQRLLDEDPSALEMKFAVAVVALQMKDYATAERQLLELKEAGFGEPGQVDANLAQLSEDGKRYDEALARYRDVDEGERWWGAQLKIAAMLGKLGRGDEARAHLAALVPTGTAQAVQRRQAEAQLLRDGGRDGEAFDLLSSSLEEWPDNQDILYDLAMVAEKLDRLDEAERRLRRLLELAPESAHALNALGYTLVDRTDRIREGYDLIEKAVKLSPNDPFILDSLGWAHFRLGNYDESEKVLRRALAERPDAEIAAHLGEVLWVKGQREQAREVWQSQLRENPDHPLILETIRRLER
jgi:tetratricopeptide (TPR) repeat protein